MLGLDVAADRTELHRRIGVVPENYGLYDRLSGRRHVVLATEVKNATADPDKLLERVGLSPADANRPAGEYSTGMSQRLALTMALVGSPDLLILDEPTAGLELNSTRELGRSSRLKVTAVWPRSSPVTSSNRSRPSPTASESWTTDSWSRPGFWSSCCSPRDSRRWSRSCCFSA